MSGVNFTMKQFLWFYDPKNNSDKVWGYVEVEGKIYNFWGRRADLDGKKKLTFKRWTGTWGAYDAQDKAREKMRKGYKTVDSTRSADGEYAGIEAVYPNFVKSFKQQLMFARLANVIRGERDE